MKKGWEYKKLEDCFVSINNGANIRQVKGAKGIPVTRIETLSNDKFNRERMGYADILDASPYSSYILNDGDILMSHINSMKFLGRAVQYSKKGNETIIHGMNLLRLVPTKDVLSSFLVYQFYTAFFRNQIVSISHQSVNQASFNTTNLKNLKLKVPTLSEQQSIVEYLDSAFAKIDAMKANAEKALNEAKALFQASLKEMLEPKEGWGEKKLGDCFISINNGANIRQVKGAKGIPVTRIETLSNDKFNRERMGYADILDASPYSSYILNDGDILMSHINSMKFLGRAVQYSKKENETIIHGMNLLRLVPTKDVLSSFLVYQFYTAFFRNQIVSISHQSVNQASFNTTNLKNLKLKVPPLSEQQSIVDYLDSLKSKVDRLQENYDKISQECDALKQSILRQVFE